MLIECEICKGWFHTGCVDLTDNEYEMLASHKLGTIHWYCTTCNVISVELLRLVFGLQDRIQKTKSEIKNMKRETSAKFSKIESAHEAVNEDFEPENRRSQNLKNIVMESVSKLKHADEKYSRIILTHDMATEDREEYGG